MQKAGAILAQVATIQVCVDGLAGSVVEIGVTVAEVSAVAEERHHTTERVHEETNERVDNAEAMAVQAATIAGNASSIVAGLLATIDSLNESVTRTKAARARHVLDQQRRE